MFCWRNGGRKSTSLPPAAPNSSPPQCLNGSSYAPTALRAITQSLLDMRTCTCCREKIIVRRRTIPIPPPTYQLTVYAQPKRTLDGLFFFWRGAHLTKSAGQVLAAQREYFVTYTYHSIHPML